MDARARPRDDGVEDRGRVLALLRVHGWNSTSFQVLEPGFRYWFDRDACVAYVDTGGAWVVAGAPIAPRERFAEIANAFAAAARSAGRRASFFGTEPRFHDAIDWPALRIGDVESASPSAEHCGSSRSC
jgi:phosphatidylglycerol lysyltransferase